MEENNFQKNDEIINATEASSQENIESIDDAICPKCGKQVSSKMMFCPHCSAKLKKGKKKKLSKKAMTVLLITVIVELLIGIFAIYWFAIRCDHDYTSTITTKPTCVAEGEKTFTCTKCNKTYTEKIEKDVNAHNYAWELVKKATCKEEGSFEYTCTRCGNSYTESIKSSHSWAAATCTTPKTCMVCGATEGSKSDVHSFDNNGKCTVCGKMNYKIIKSAGVNFKVPGIEQIVSDRYSGEFKFTDISVKYEPSTSGYSNFYVYYSGEKTEGGSFDTTMFKYALYDSEGYVVASGSKATKSLNEGEKVKNDMFEIFLNHANGADLKSGHTYELKILNND